MTLFKCGVCGYIHEGDEAIKCPKCGAPAEQFTKLEEEDAKKVIDARVTNAIHMELIGAYEHIAALSEEGIEEDLDPNCVAIFKKANAHAIELIGSIKAELAGHINKGKWG